jgi:hypothetical protein
VVGGGGCYGDCDAVFQRHRPPEITRVHLVGSPIDDDGDVRIVVLLVGISICQIFWVCLCVNTVSALSCGDGVVAVRGVGAGAGVGARSMPLCAESRTARGHLTYGAVSKTCGGLVQTE